MQSRDEIFKDIVAIISSALNTPIAELSDKSSPSSVESWDSINNLTIISDLEDKFDVIFSIDDIFEMQTIGDICNKIQHLKAK
jgi:acyl carrier protein